MTVTFRCIYKSLRQTDQASILINADPWSDLFTVSFRLSHYVRKTDSNDVGASQLEAHSVEDCASLCARSKCAAFTYSDDHRCLLSAVPDSAMEFAALQHVEQ